MPSCGLTYQWPRMHVLAPQAALVFRSASQVARRCLFRSAALHVFQMPHRCPCVQLPCRCLVPSSAAFLRSLDVSPPCPASRVPRCLLLAFSTAPLLRPRFFGDLAATFAYCCVSVACLAQRFCAFGCHYEVEWLIGLFVWCCDTADMVDV